MTESAQWADSVKCLTVEEKIHALYVCLKIISISYDIRYFLDWSVICIINFNESKIKDIIL